MFKMIPSLALTLAFAAACAPAHHDSSGEGGSSATNAPASTGEAAKGKIALPFRDDAPPAKTPISTPFVNEPAAASPSAATPKPTRSVAAPVTPPFVVTSAPVSVKFSSEVLLCPAQVPRSLVSDEVERFDHETLLGRDAADFDTAFANVLRRLSALSPLRAGRVRAAVTEFLRDARDVAGLGSSTVGAVWRPPGCALANVAQLTDDGPRIDRALWRRLSAADQVAAILPLALSSEATHDRAQNSASLRRLARLLVRDRELTLKDLATALLRVRERPALEIPFENGEIVLFTLSPGIDDVRDWLNKSVLNACGFRLADGTFTDNCADKNARPLSVSTDGRKRIYRVHFSYPRDGEGPVYLVKPMTLGLPSTVVDYQFEAWSWAKSDPKIAFRMVTLWFANDTQMATPFVRTICRANQPVTMFFPREQVEKYKINYADGQLFSCFPSGGFQVVLAGQPLEFHASFVGTRSDYYLAPGFTLAVSGASGVSFNLGVGQFQLRDGDEISFSGTEPVVTFKSAETKPVKLGGCLVKPSGVLVSSHPYFAGWGDQKCHIGRGNATAAGVGQFVVNLETNKVATLFSPDTGVVVHAAGQTIKTREANFDADGNLVTISSYDASGWNHIDVRYFDTASQKYIRSGDQYDGPGSFCYNLSLNRFEDPQSPNCVTTNTWQVPERY